MNVQHVMKKWLTYSIMAVFVLTTFFAYSPTSYAETDELGIKGEAAILVDARTGKILYEKNADALLSPASMTKMMTEYLVHEAIKEKRIKWDQEVGISEYAHKISQNTDLSNVPLKLDEKYTVQELYESMAIYSANGSTIALAELIAGSEKKFVEQMNKKAEELGLQHFKFVNSTGLNNKDLQGMHVAGEANEENLLSARATAKLAFYLVNEYPDVLETAKIPVKWFRKGIKDQETHMDNWNWMIPGSIEPQFDYEGIDGLKTGSTDLAGYCFTGTAKKGDVRLISVVMKTDSYNARFDETKKLLNYGFNNFEEKELFPAGYQLKKKSTLPVIKGKEDSVEVAAKDALTAVIRNGEKDDYSVKYEFDKKLLNDKGELTAPIKKGQKVGKVILVNKGDEDYGYLTKDGAKYGAVDLVTTSGVEKANWFVLTMRGIGGFFGDIWSSVADTVKGWF